MLSVKHGGYRVRHERELYRSTNGPAAEDSWRLIYEDGRLFVRHEWSRADVPRSGDGNNGQSDMNLETFLNDSEQGKAHQELRRILDQVFNA